MIDFDSKARAWDADPRFIERGRRLAEAIESSVDLHPDMRVLDYGGGTGLLSFPLLGRLGHVTLIDNSAGMLEVVREKVAAQGITSMTPRQGDLSNGILPGERFHLIVSAMTLHHIPDTCAILTAFHRLLTPGGTLCVADLDQEDGSFHGQEVDVHHGFDRAELAVTAHAAGFSAVRFQTVLAIDKETEQGLRRYPVFLMVAS